MATALAEQVGAMVPVAYRVAARIRDTADVWTLTLAPVSEALERPGPGQFVMVTAFGLGEVPISVSGVTDADDVVLTVRVVGAVTRAICASHPRVVLGLRGPFGSRWPVEAAEGGDVLVVAGGIGLAPLRPVVVHAVEHRAAFGAAALLYGARTPGELLYGDQLERWGGVIETATTVDAADAEWRGRVGVVTKLVAAARFDPPATTAFVCGPEIMMRFTAQALLDHGVAPGRIHVSLERHMDCGVGLCGHCQLGPTLICRDGAVYGWATAAPWLAVQEL
jgi:anaerobic sulfite reductase subunit B